ncbi:uncharacterized protein PGTG_05706 [Puccinia graminis f. sp. tritici CRL 75-36-700-3]|uniref:Uncharacterized protein n=1 Tax=Puccinia graminis f. sp. tritici (strain CRL 75-36-700-3 / race SCCL) TaxID=418459 RepID=E3K464_PUCGT|nr:uncharacterized protein PGTG_05706 [Puccinia graminis f. sp. tritici CRL 75-36-700-3]EFP79385.1 hypothetical protein PGTG_05706 [Puccinia graminis f. sp. tritici CRL 75-36-700-3]
MGFLTTRPGPQWPHNIQTDEQLRLNLSGLLGGQILGPVETTDTTVIWLSHRCDATAVVLPEKHELTGLQESLPGWIKWTPGGFFLSKLPAVDCCFTCGAGINCPTTLTNNRRLACPTTNYDLLLKHLGEHSPV